jgi:Integrase core domain
VHCGQHSRSHNGPGHRSGTFCRDTKWRSVKYEEVYLHAYRDGREAQHRLRAYFETYNSRRLHQALNYGHRTKRISAAMAPLALAA